ncbi:MAG: copper resistance CopC family protein [Chloroflexota bacterium]
MKPYYSLLVMIIFVIVVIGPSMGRYALAQSILRRSDPALDAVLDRPPSEVFVWFTEPLSTGSRLNVFDDQFQDVDKGQTFIDASDATLMRAQIRDLSPGRYTVNWKANTVDGREITGSYNFKVRSTPNMTLLIGLGVLLMLSIVYLLGLVIRHYLEINS